MKKFYGFSAIELIVTIFVIYVVVQFSFDFSNKFNQAGKRELLIKKVYTTLEEITRKENEKLPVAKWGWGEFETYVSSKNILTKYIAPSLNKYRPCNNPLNCVGGFLSMDGEDYVNYRQKTDYARAIVGKDNIHIALKSEGGCTQGDANSICGIFIIDIDNKDGANKLGEDVFIFAFYGDGAFHPYGYNYESKKIEAGCAKFSYGDTCAAKIMNDNWQIRYGNSQ